MSRTNRAVHQYLDRHAEPEAAVGSGLAGRFGHVLTIPAAGEGESLHEVLASIPPGPLGDVLVILVVNEPIDAPHWMTRANRALLERLGSDRNGARDWGAGGTCFETPYGALLLIDRASDDRELPAKQGVGLARKIGADIALAMWSANAVESPWIHCTDADVALPTDYFEQPLSASAEAVALTYAFRHVTEQAVRETNRGAGTAGEQSYTPLSRAAFVPLGRAALVPLGRAALEYEISLRYYVRGLEYAGSPFAFHTIGSTMAVRAEAYAQVRGFPKRLAAEDFYLLNKLAKVGHVEPVAGRPIELSSRISERVPFGTGRALSDASESQSRLLYHPAIFDHLAAWQAALHRIARSPRMDARTALHEIDIPSGIDLDVLVKALDSIGDLDGRPLRAKSEEVRLRQLQHSFDARRTLKLVHALRDAALPSIDLLTAVGDAAFGTPSQSGQRDAAEFRSDIDRLEAIAIALGRP